MTAKVLVACEFSGVVRDAFIARGHDAISCDLLPSETPGPHIQADVLPLLQEPWDLVIAHPPCTYLCNSGVRWLHELNPPDRWQRLADGAEFFLHCWHANAPLLAVENPTMHMYAKDIIGVRYSFAVQPYEFGHAESKRTCLWTKGLPTLMPTCLVRDPEQSVWREPPGDERAMIRSKTFPGIASAMADQWGALL